MDTIDTAEIDLDSTDRDGELPPQVVATLILHGDFEATCEAYVSDATSGKLKFNLPRSTAEELHAELTKVLFG